MAANLIEPGDIGGQVTASGGKAYVSWQFTPRAQRMSFTVDERSGEVIDNQWPDLNPLDLPTVCELLRAAGKDRVACQVERRYA